MRMGSSDLRTKDGDASQPISKLTNVQPRLNHSAAFPFSPPKVCLSLFPLGFFQLQQRSGCTQVSLNAVDHQTKLFAWASTISISKLVSHMFLSLDLSNYQSSWPLLYLQFSAIHLHSWGDADPTINHQYFINHLTCIVAFSFTLLTSIHPRNGNYGG